MDRQYLTGALSGFSTYSGVYGPAALFLLGALVAGTDWGRGTLKAALLQGPGRLPPGSARTWPWTAAQAPAGQQLPGPCARGQGLLLALACTAIGLALGTILRPGHDGVSAERGCRSPPCSPSGS